MWHALWPDRGRPTVPIGHVTNGVHEPTWLGDPMRALLDRHLGDGLARAAAADPATGRRSRRSRRRSCGRRAREQRAALVEAVRERSVLERLGRGDHARLRAGGRRDASTPTR